MLSRLTAGPATVSELASLAMATWPTGMKHVRLLEASGLISSERFERTRTCYLNTDALRFVQAWIEKREKI